MKIIKLSAMAATVLAASAFAPQFTVAADLQPGKGWDAFAADAAEEMVSTQAFVGTSMESGAGQGYDTVMANDGSPLPPDSISYQGTSTGSPTGQGYDTFMASDGERI